MYDIAGLVREPALLGPLRQSVEQGAPPAYLRSLKVKLTARCNLRCVMCRYGRGEVLPELATDAWLALLADAARLGCRKVHFSGGEVLSRPDFEALVEAAAGEGLKVTFTSNLTLLTKERAKRLLSSKISGLSTSLDGATARTHDGVRGMDGSFKRTLRALDWVARYRKRPDRPRVRINFVMLRQNYREYPALVRMAGELGAVDVVPMPVDSKRTSLRLGRSAIARYNLEVAPRVLEERLRAGMPVDDGYVHPFGRDAREQRFGRHGEYAGGYYRTHLCHAPFLHAFVAWDGNVYLCCMTNGRMEPLGNIAQQSLAQVFLGERFAAARAAMLAERPAACHGCDMYLRENRQLGAALGRS